MLCDIRRQAESSRMTPSHTYSDGQCVGTKRTAVWLPKKAGALFAAQRTELRMRQATIVERTTEQIYVSREGPSSETGEQVRAETGRGA